MARYTGLKESVVLQFNLNIPYDFFWKELLRDQSFTVGRLDSRYRGIDRQDAGRARITMLNSLRGCILLHRPSTCI
ncbi:hypothetical protein MKQ70_17545 [Chitinophaga sedimenti]|uniref:hypothetical protein n=1 Tax=Chitinophaga sedimenti TaxID=2033606 RepID=UPI002005C11C|nr:hypothetical protein [Chitinophaga sedimenti]MCK7556725.1 hypothetical protein [Chitinophaga sedimenti]